MSNTTHNIAHCYFCLGENLSYINFHGEELYECRDCGRLTSLDGQRVRSVMEDI